MVFGTEGGFHVKPAGLGPALVVLSTVGALLVVLLHTVSGVVFLGTVGAASFCSACGGGVAKLEASEALGNSTLLVIGADDVYFSIDY